MGGDGECRLGEVRADTTSPIPDHKGFKLQWLVNFQKFSTLRVKLIYHAKFTVLSWHVFIWTYYLCASAHGEVCMFMVAPGVGTWIKSHYVMSYWCICHPHRSSCLTTVLDMIKLTHSYCQKWIVRCYDAGCHASFHRKLLRKELAMSIFHNFLYCIWITDTSQQSKDQSVRLICSTRFLFRIASQSCIW